MSITIFIPTRGKLILTDKEYLASGGEAAVYRKDKFAYKIYHDQSKMISKKKIQELQQISANNVLKPIEIIQSNNKDIGYVMPFVSDTCPLCKLFTKTFRDKNNLNSKDIVEIVKIIQQTIIQIHDKKILIVDLNELNMLTSNKFDNVYFIDTDSYATPSYRATAIMESIKDPQVKSNHFTIDSDWFSFAIIAMQLYIGIHPYRGKHPGYKPSEWQMRMKDGISIFDPDVRLPHTCYDFSVIPKSHYNWFKEIFVKGNRGIPPLPDDIIIVPVQKYKVVQSTGDFDIKIVWDMGGVILYSYYYGGCEFLVSKNTIFCDEKVYRTHQMGKIGMCDSGDELFPAICQLDDNKLKFFGPRDVEIEELHSDNFMMRNGCIYSVYDGKLTECSVAKLGSKYFLKTRLACNVSDLSTKVFEGVIFQDLLGKCYITLPFEIGRCIFNPIKELHGYRILDAKSERNIVVVLAEKKSTYYRFIITYDDKFNDYKIRKQDDVSFGSVNFTVKPNGVCILASDNEVEIFKDEKIKIVSNSPFDTDTKLFNRNGDIFFIDEKRVYSVRTK